jgi:polyribonucleotide nucleotidyltransferase
MMNREVFTKTIDLGDGRPVTIETGKLAQQADGAVVVRLGDTMLLATVVANKEAKEGIDFLPLTVEYKEKYAAAGRFPGGFFKREGRPGDDEILTSRLVDRALRPMFPDDYHAETQVIITLISSDKQNLADALAGLAASAALAVSDIPFNGPISEVRVARINGKFEVNPTADMLATADIDMIVAGSADSIVMVEGEMKEVSEDEMVQAISIAHDAIRIHCKAQLELASMVAKSSPKREYSHETHDDEMRKRVKDFCYQSLYDIARKGSNKDERKAAFDAVKDSFKATLSAEELAVKEKFVGPYFKEVQKEAVRRVILDENIRLDGRGLRNIRPIWCEVDYLPGSHGSAIFTRGETQSLTSLTLGTKLDEQLIDRATVQYNEKFMLHYNFPPFSTGEARALRGTSRREIGHGNLAFRAIKPVLPGTDVCPYTIRLVSDILESNGSSSMATVCAGTLSLMDGGVPISAPVSGIAMGLITDPDGKKYAVLSDILGDEDHLGDMDFKVTGTAKGITACQMDIKINGLSQQVLKEALEQAKEGRLHILGEMLKTIENPRADYKPHAPRIVSFEVPTDMIGPIIGPGGKIIQEIQKETKSTISIEEKDGKGYVEISADNKESIDAAVMRVRNIAFPRTIEIGEIYEGKVKTLMPYGAFVEIVPGQEGLLHVSELEWRRIENVTDVLKEGDIVKFQVVGRDQKTGKVRLSRKVLLPKPEGFVEEEPRQDRGDRGGDRRDRGDRGDRGDRRDRGPRPHRDN